MWDDGEERKKEEEDCFFLPPFRRGREEGRDGATLSFFSPPSLAKRMM